MECRFCNIIKHQYIYDEIDQPIHENKDFMSIASIGAIIEGWSLIIPKKHGLSMRSFYKDNSLSKFINDILPSMQKKYGRVIAFEHGTNHIGSPTGCGTDHAHLHLVPFSDSLLEKIFSSGLEWNKCLSSELNEISNGEEYLFYTELNSNSWDNPSGYVHILKYPISQFFRKLLAEHIGKLDEADYKKHLFLDNARATKLSIQELIA